MRYHVVVFKILDPKDPPEAEVAIVDEAFDADMTVAEMVSVAERFRKRATETLTDHAVRSTGEAHADLAAWRASAAFTGLAQAAFLAGHAAGYMRGLA